MTLYDLVGRTVKTPAGRYGVILYLMRGGRYAMVRYGDGSCVSYPVEQLEVVQ